MSGTGNMVLGSVSFGPACSFDWRDDEPSLREMYDAACRTIVRMECQAEEREARIAVLEQQANIIARERSADRRTIEILRDARDRYKRMAGVSSDWDTMESVRDKYDARDEAGGMEI